MKTRETHGKRKTPEYQSWAHMIGRCTNVRDEDYPDYGGRGISVCPKWRNSFASFLKDVGQRPSVRHSIDRINVDGDYEPGNVRWALVKVQNRNKRKTVYLTLDGVTKALSDWAEHFGMNYNVLRSRIRYGWTPEEILNAKYRPHAGSRFLTASGKTQTVTEWARELGMDRQVIFDRLRRGWREEDAIQTR